MATSQMDGCDHLDDVHFALENVSSPLTPPVTAQPCTAQPCTAQPSPALHCTALPWLAECSVQIIWLVTYEVGGTLKLEI